MNVYVHKNGTRIGPLELNEINARVAQNELEGTDRAWISGWAGWQTLAQVPGFVPREEPPPFVPEPPPFVPEPPAPPAAVLQECAEPILAEPLAEGPTEPLFFYIPTSRLLVMSLVSLGFYQTLWSYRNWRFLRVRCGSNVSPFWRAFFSVLFMYWLLKAIKQVPEANARCKATFSPGGLAIGYILLNVFGNGMFRSVTPGMAWLPYAVIISSVFCLLPVQDFIKQINESLPIRPSYHPWSWGQVLLLILGASYWILILVGLATA